jgi:ABC-type lipopolysaccharide export system ATPase subunit
VLHHGEVLAEGTAATVLSDRRVIGAYLGARYAARQTAEGQNGEREPT